MKTTTERVFQIFKELNQIPRPSHHEERVADYLCRFAERLNLPYKRDKENCVVISKPATKGYEGAEPVVLLNHMDMVCVGMSDPLNTPIDAYIENGWMKARGTSEEDGMSGASQLSRDFLKGRKVINLDSEDYDTITTGAAGACLQFHRIPMERKSVNGAGWHVININGGLGGHSGVDINKGRCSAVKVAWAFLDAIRSKHDIEVASINIGEANASIASSGEIIIHTPSGDNDFLMEQVKEINEQLHELYGDTDPNIRCTINEFPPQKTVINPEAINALMTCLEQVPQGVIKMSESMEDTVETSNNIGRIQTEEDSIFISTHTRSFIDADMKELSRKIADVFAENGAKSEMVMSAPAWQEDQQSAFLQLTSDTFQDVLGWRPRMVAMHFVLEAGFFVEHYPGIQIASIGPRIVEPHSTSERVELKTIEDIWQVLIELLKRLAD